MMDLVVAAAPDIQLRQHESPLDESVVAAIETLELLMSDASHSR